MYLSEKGRVGSECIIFQEKWTDKYFCISMNRKALHFICSESVLLLLPVTTIGASRQAQKLGWCRGKMKRRLESQSNGCTRQSNERSSALQASFCATDLMTEECNFF